MSDYKEQAIYRQYLQKKNEDVAAPREIKYKQQVSLNKIHSDPRLNMRRGSNESRKQLE